MGRGNIFGAKDGDRVQGTPTRIGSIRFEDARKRLSVMAGRANVSDSDTIEYLARGEAATRKFLKQRK